LAGLAPSATEVALLGPVSAKIHADRVIRTGFDALATAGKERPVNLDDAILRVLRDRLGRASAGPHAGRALALLEDGEDQVEPWRAIRLLELEKLDAIAEHVAAEAMLEVAGDFA
jgi:hypothetical protein